MRLFTSIFCTLFLALSAFGQAIDYRALRTNQFSTNIPSRGYVGIIGYGVTNIPGTNVQFNSGTGITFTTNGAAITITATGTNQVVITNIVLRAGTNVVVETNGPTDWTINGQPGLWLTNAADGSITNINTGSGTAYVSGTNGLLVLNNAASGKNILLTGETNGTPSFRLRSDGSMFLGKHVTNDVNTADFTTTYPLYFNGYTLSNDPVLASFKIGNQDQNGIPTFFSVISGGVLANKDTGSAIWTAQASTTNGLSRTWQIRAKSSLSQLAFATETNTAFKVDDKGDISIIKSVPYLWPLTNGGASQFLTTDGGNPQQLSWGAGGVNVAAGTNITLVTNSGLVTISVANTNLPVVVAGSNITVATNGIAYTVSGSGGASVVVAGTNVTVQTNGSAYTVNSTGGAASIGPGTVNQVSKFVTTSNVGDSIVAETATNMWQWKSRVAPNAYTNHITNEMVGQWTNPTNWTALDLVSAGPANEFNELHAVHGSSYTTGDWPLKLMDTWSIESPTPTGGHSAGELFPAADDTYIIGDSSHQVKNVYVGTGGIDIGIAATKPALRFHNNFVSTWYGVDGTGSSLAFYRDTGITAAFDRFNNLFVLDVAGNYIGFGSSGVSNCTAFLSTGEAVTNGLVQVGTNSAVANPVPAGIMSSRGSGTDKGGADLVVAGGVSTGTGTSGKILFATSGSAAGSSPTLNGLTNRMEIDPGTGNVTIYSNLTVNGSFSAGSISDPNALTNNDTRNITFTGTFTDTQNGVSTTIASNTITSGTGTFTGSGNSSFGSTAFFVGISNNDVSTLVGRITNAALTASRLVLSDANKALSSAAASGAVPVDADGSAATFAQVNALAPGFVVTNGATGNVLLAGSNTLTAALDMETAAELRTTNNAGSTGQILTSAGSGKSPYWATQGSASVTVQTNSATLNAGATTINFVAGANTTVTGAVSGATATIGISSSGGGSLPANPAVAANAGALAQSLIATNATQVWSPVSRFGSRFVAVAELAGSGQTWNGMGIAPPTFQGSVETIASTATEHWAEGVYTPATAGNTNYVTIGGTLFPTGKSGTFLWTIQLTNTTNVRLCAGIAPSGPGVLVGDPDGVNSGRNGIFLKYSTNSANWYLVTENTSTATQTDTGIAASTGKTSIGFMLNATNGVLQSVVGLIDGVPGGTNSASLPSAACGAFMTITTTTDNAAKEVKFFSFYAEQDH